MTREEAIKTLRRIRSAGRLPDQWDVRVAEVCADRLEDPNHLELKAIMVRHRILVASGGKQ